ncbi:MAG: hypothetical protein ACLFM8_07950 [Halobacteriales archaeon]
MTDRGWFEGVDPDDVEAATERIRSGTAETPRNWPAEAVASGAVDDVDAYYDALHAGAMAAVEGELEAIAGAADVELVQLARTHDAVRALANELGQRLLEAHAAVAPTAEGDDLEALRTRVETDGPLSEHLGRLASVAADLEAELETLERDLELTAHEVAPNLAAMAGPALAARLVAAAGSLEDLARQPSSTVQVLGAEDALFAHLRGEAPPPKHGLIFTHPAVRGTPRETRGRVARTIAGKLAIAARVDHYRGELDADLQADLESRLADVRGERS